ncbi:helix-turn-helix domain-containing protein [Providencia vermicola]|uniref:Helix-turn-helix transcriptional regulator n=4 Tax=Providencia TaxID=586 RepID=A0AAI9I2M5_PROST|nr:MULTISPECIES: helix-turn-helix transcriptional regulator [Providencia]ELR5046091.1 helix-turn-helix transcriptional regulator [Providencia rettgeri]MTB39727.1 helix-turn-helix domain-containing protein [Providencia sp. wls1949]WBA56337.1 helix-turn-helix transcriptional regulator [Providencia sp. 21OH12SH02B-Prov]ELR5037243.1 helix-turn-helix transcriptional regulator [Providencia stuartii]ELR5122118.1 helix-turn-helix transcriptional regulator [Providencia stuartii]
MDYLADEINKKIGAYIRRIRKEKNYSGYQLATMLNVSQQQVSRYETGQTKLTFEMVDGILLALNKTWKDLFNAVMDEHDNERIKDAIKKDRVYYHILNNVSNKIWN